MILTHGNARHGYYKDSAIRAKIEQQSTSLINFVLRPDLGQLVGLEVSRPTLWEVWVVEPSQKKRKNHILHVSVGLPRTGLLLANLGFYWFGVISFDI